MTIDDIKALIAAHESRTLELKKTTGELKDGMHSACAFLNADGDLLKSRPNPSKSRTTQRKSQRNQRTPQRNY